MDLKKYQKFCASVAGKYEKEKEIMTWGLGVAGEAGDLAGCIKKTYSHDHDQIDGIKENVGDTLWYLAMICNFYGWTLDEAFEENVKKLKKRYPEGKFTFKHAKRDGKRIDWNEKGKK